MFESGVKVGIPRCSKSALSSCAFHAGPEKTSAHSLDIATGFMALDCRHASRVRADATTALGCSKTPGAHPLTPTAPSPHLLKLRARVGGSAPTRARSRPRSARPRCERKRSGAQRAAPRCAERVVVRRGAEPPRRTTTLIKVPQRGRRHRAETQHAKK